MTTCTHILILPQAVFKVSKDKGLILTEFADGVSVGDIRATTGAPFEVMPGARINLHFLLRFLLPQWTLCV